MRKKIRHSRKEQRSVNHEMSTGKEDRENIHARIQQAALKCFVEKGYGGTTVAEIARQAGISAPTLYLYFDGKQALFDSLERPDLDFPAPQTVERRQQIVAAALHVFSRKGYAGATMDEVAQTVGLSKAALYMHFAGKEQLLAAVLENSAVFAVLDRFLGDRWAEVHLVTDADDPQTVSESAYAKAEAFLCQVALAYLSMFREPTMRNLMRIILAEWGKEPAVSSTFILTAVERGSALVANFLEKLGLGTHQALQETVQAFMGMLFSQVILHKLLAHPEGKSEAETIEQDAKVAERTARLFLYGIVQVSIGPAARTG
jgi:AcrR family transcriptional regulator